MKKFAAFRNLLSVIVTAMAVAAFSRPAQAQPTTQLAAGLVPAITLNGPLGSMQLVQYSTNLANTDGWTAIAGVRMFTANQIFFDAAGTNLTRRFYRAVMVSVADTNLVWIPQGTFVMGSPVTESDRNTNEGPQTTVTFTNGFFMGRYEVRRADWAFNYPQVFDENEDSLRIKCTNLAICGG